MTAESFLEAEAQRIEQAGRFRLIQANALEIKPPDWLIENRLEVDTLALLFGDPKTGKSFIAIDQACSVATGLDYHGNRVERSPVIYIAGEGHNGIARRLKAWEIARQMPLDDAPLFVSEKAARMLDQGSVDGVIEAVEEIAAEHGAPRLIVLDTLARNFGPGDESSTQDMNNFVQAADRLRTAHSAAVLIVHHTGHSDKQRARGSIALKGAIDAEFRVDADESGVVRMECTAMKDAKAAEPMAFRLREVDLGVYDANGNEVTSAVADPEDYEPAQQRSSRGRGKNQRIATEQLERLHREQRQRILESGRDPDQVRITLDDWRKACLEAGIAKQRFYEIRDKATQSGIARIEYGFVYPL